MTVFGLRLGLLALFLAAWEIAGRMVNPLLGVPPSAVLPSIRDLVLLRSYPDLPASLWLRSARSRPRTRWRSPPGSAAASCWGCTG
jgi:hypothetical protein